ncbi:xanthine dehydrogenase family protein molybdopterin-binding subunit [Peptoniphilus catoniae]|uniref:xanthine dehydrogenase family protein molybdopterin-binding subunit n=1 Tax=Peptoniphilus catoniae TaxID=1660341 RepID=UPI0010FD4F74|nr:xanthine dehydrogenase family protein molybdopterin-binding subunit [Peptoniphilus catoniae]
MRVIGTNQPVHDALGKATGHTKYCSDIKMTGMLHLAVIFSSIPHGYVEKIDTSEAMKLEGVKDIIHCFNTTDKTFNRYRSQAIQNLPEHECIFNRHVRFIGDRVGAVIATSEEIARKAAKLVKVTYKELPYSVTPEDSLNGVIDDVLEEGPVVAKIDAELGEKNYPIDAIKVCTHTKLARITHACMETHAAIADYDKYSGQLTIWSPNQAVHGIRTVIGDLFNISYNNVRVVKTTMGGSFGAKQEWMLEPVVAAAALKMGCPVKLVYNREETIISTVTRSPMDAKVESIFTKDGKLLSITIDNTLDAGAYMGNSGDYAGALGSKFFRTYNYPHMKYNARAVITNSPVSGAYRGWTAPEIAAMVEHNMNKAAKVLKMDPIDIRLRNVAVEGDIDPKLNEPMGPIRTYQALELGREKFQWDKKKADIEEFNKNNDRYKRGMAVGCGGHVNGYYPRMGDFAAAQLRIAEDGSVIGSLSIHDHGCGSVTAMKMIISETLDMDLDKIKVSEADTDNTPLDFGCYSSRTVYVIGRTTQKCAENLLNTIKENIAQINNISSSEITFENGSFYFIKDGKREDYSYKRAARESMSILRKEIVSLEQFVETSNPGVTGTHFAEVEVDTYTGLVKILDYLAIHDIGKALNRQICIAQTQGAVLMGGGAALIEEVITGSNGVATKSFKDYHLINAFDAPETKVEFIEDGQTDGPFGAKSIGEVSHVPVAPTVAGAVNNALGTEIGEIPINTDTIVRTMAEKNMEKSREAK